MPTAVNAPKNADARKKFGELLVLAIRRKSSNQSALASVLKVSDTAVSKWCRGRGLPRNIDAALDALENLNGPRIEEQEVRGLREAYNSAACSDASIGLRELAGRSVQSATVFVTAKGKKYVDTQIDALQGAAKERDFLIESLVERFVTKVEESKELSIRLARYEINQQKIVALARRIAENVDDFDKAYDELEDHVKVAIEVSREGKGGNNLGDFVNTILARGRSKYEANDFDAAADEATKGFEEWERREKIGAKKRCKAVLRYSTSL